MSDRLIVKRGEGTFDDWRKVVVRKTGELVGWLQRDGHSSVVAWDAYDSDKKWLRGFSYQSDAVRYLAAITPGDTK